jgi:hypothetical protein
VNSKGKTLSKFIFAIFIVFLSATCIAQQPAAGQPASGSDALPTAPQPRLASLSHGFFGKLEGSSVREAAPKPTAVASPALEGTRVRLSLITPVSSKSPNGSSFQARLEGPLAGGGAVLLPQGTLFEGHLESRRARRMMRPGSLFLTFDRLALPDGSVQRVNLHLVSANSAAVKTDVEGLLHPALNKKRLAIQVGGTALTAKFADDLVEFAGGAAVGAGTARLIGAGAATTFFILQKGGEVKLQPGDKLNVEFDRSVTACGPPTRNAPQ